jgi:hypothetical protein
MVISAMKVAWSHGTAVGGTGVGGMGVGGTGVGASVLVAIPPGVGALPLVGTAETVNATLVNVCSASSGVGVPLYHSGRLQAMTAIRSNMNGTPRVCFRSMCSSYNEVDIESHDCRCGVTAYCRIIDVIAARNVPNLISRVCAKIPDITIMKMGLMI